MVIMRLHQTPFRTPFKNACDLDKFGKSRLLWKSLTKYKNSKAVFLKLFVAVDPFVLSTFFRLLRNYFWSLLIAWVPQPPRQEANFRLRPAANWRHQYKIKKVSRSWTCHITAVVRLSWIMT